MTIKIYKVLCPLVINTNIISKYILLKFLGKRATRLDIFFLIVRKFKLKVSNTGVARGEIRILIINA